MSETEEQPQITFVQFRKPLDDDRFFLIRCANGVPIHWLSPYGAWVAFPEDDEQAGLIFEKLVDSDEWPVWEASWSVEVDDGKDAE